MKIKYLALGLGLVTLSYCGGERSESNSFRTHQNYTPRAWYVQETENSTTYIFDREGDGIVDEVLKLSEDKHAHYLSKEADPDRSYISKTNPEILSDDEQSQFNKFIQSHEPLF